MTRLFAPAALLALAAWSAGCATAPGSGAASGDSDAADAPGSGDEAVDAVRPPETTHVVAAYRVVVANESSDLVSRLEFRPGAGVYTLAEVEVGIQPGDIDGPHGIQVSPDGRYWYVTIAHGQPFGTLWKHDMETGERVGRAELGMFPASMGITPDGEFLFVVNFNLHGDPVPSTMSVVHAPSMTEVARPTLCVMPHGARVNQAGTRVYTVCMHSDQLVELDTRTFEVTGRFSLVPGREAPLAADDTGEEAHESHARPDGAVCSPTWVTPGRGERAGRFVYVACNRNQEVLEVDVADWRVTRRFPTGRAPYNLEATPDGELLIASLKGEQAVAFIDLERGVEAARRPTSQPVTHGVAVSSDGRFAFVTNEAVGGTNGTLDVFDLVGFERVASGELHFQPGGIATVPGGF